jgi:hypothetical protein
MSDLEDAQRIRRADCRLLDAALADCRAGTLRAFASCERALQARNLRVPYSPQINPPLWELGHVGWFQEYWIARNPQWRQGVAADPLAPRAPSLLAGADTLYDSGRVEHTSRWHLPLPACGNRLRWRIEASARQRKPRKISNAMTRMALSLAFPILCLPS